MSCLNFLCLALLVWASLGSPDLASGSHLSRWFSTQQDATRHLFNFLSATPQGQSQSSFLSLANPKAHSGGRLKLPSKLHNRKKTSSSNTSTRGIRIHPPGVLRFQNVMLWEDVTRGELLIESNCTNLTGDVLLDASSTLTIGAATLTESVVESLLALLNCNGDYSGESFECSDECVLGTDECNVNAACTNTNDGYDCACNIGYSGDGFQCSAVPCPVNSVGTNVLTDDCVCDAGFVGTIVWITVDPYYTGSCIAMDPFITIWEVTAGQLITLPLYSNGTYHFTVDWGDASSLETITSDTAAHTFATAGTYTIALAGTIVGFGFNNGGNKDSLLEISAWSSVNLGDTGASFYGCSNLQVTAIDAPDMQGVTTLYQMFRACPLLNADFNAWDTSSVTDMEYMFRSATAFDQDISAWDTSSVTNMQQMFRSATAFNQDISAWDTSSVTTMHSMLRSTAFNQDISAWDTSSVTNMQQMFQSATAFNQDISAWDTSSVTTMHSMFLSATAFNQDISAWDTSSVTAMAYMFGSTAFNQDISAWDTSSVTTMQSMFNTATAFDQDISAWDTSSVTNMQDMFYAATAFDQDISAWDVSLVTYCDGFAASGNVNWQSAEQPQWSACTP